ncbi:MAG: DUF3352 domain-containing protein [Solirubrobacteraceae bacterium]
MEEWEEPLHPGSLRRRYPTSSHNATLFAHLLPQHPHSTLSSFDIPRGAGDIARTEPTPAGAGTLQDGVHRRRLRGGLQVGPCAGPGPAHTIASPLGPHQDAALPPHLPPTSRSRLASGATGRARVLPLLLGLLAAVAIAGCGSSSSADGTEADPASVVPASAPLYLGATVRPSGAQRTGALAAGQQLTGEADPYERLLGILRTPGSPALDYQKEVAPWLGPHAGLFLSSLGSAGPLLDLVQQGLGGTSQPSGLSFGAGRLDGALVMDTTDASAARSFLAMQAKRAGARPASYRGVSYEVAPDGDAFGLVGRFAVIGSEAGLRAVIDAQQGEASLTGAPGYAKLTAQAPANAIGHLYVNPTGVVSGGGQAGGLVRLLSGGRQANISLLAASGSLTLDLDTLAAPGTGSGLLSSDPQAAEALSALPGESWLAVGLAHAGTNLSGDVLALKTIGSLLGGGSQGSTGALSLGSLLTGLTGPLQILGADTAQARSDYASWMGPAGIFAAGSSILELKAAVVISSEDPARSKAAVGKLTAQLRQAGDSASAASIAGTEAAATARVGGVPLELVIAAGRGSDGKAKFVLGLGEASVQAALSPPTTLAGASSHAAAASALGEGIQPSVMADFPTLLSLLEGVGLTEDPSLVPLLPYLRAASTLAGGGRSLGGGVERFRLVLGLHQSAG